MSKRFEQMQRNPNADWRIEDVAAICLEFELLCEKPRSGSSHYKISHPSQRAILTVPFNRPVKPVYIRKLIEFIEAVKSAP
jgi:hypothetical protein